MLAPYSLSSCVCLSATKPNRLTNRAGFWKEGFLPPIPHCIVRNFLVSPKLRYFPLELFPNSGQKISLRQVNRVVNNKTHRRRSSLLTTPIRQSTNRGCLLQVGQLKRSKARTPLSRFVMDLFCNLFLKLTRFWLTESVAVAKFLVFLCQSILQELHARSSQNLCASYFWPRVTWSSSGGAEIRYALLVCGWRRACT